MFIMNKLKAQNFYHHAKWLFIHLFRQISQRTQTKRVSFIMSLVFCVHVRNLNASIACGVHTLSGEMSCKSHALLLPYTAYMLRRNLERSASTINNVKFCRLSFRHFLLLSYVQSIRFYCSFWRETNIVI